MESVSCGGRFEKGGRSGTGTLHHLWDVTKGGHCGLGGPLDLPSLEASTLPPIFVFVTYLVVNVVATIVIIYIEHLYTLFYKGFILNLLFMAYKEAFLISLLCKIIRNLMFLVVIAYFDPNLAR